MQTQVETRIKKRLPCTVAVSDRHLTGIILNLSQRGLFVQTSMPAEPGSLIDVGFRNPSEGEEIDLQAAVVWRRRLSARMTGTTQSGMGLQLLGSPAAYDRLMAAFLRAEQSSMEPTVRPSEEPAVDLDAYVVRLALDGTPRTRHLVLTCASEEAARTLALDQAGEGWSILEITRRQR